MSTENNNLPAKQTFFADFVAVKETYETTIAGVRKAMAKYTEAKCNAENLDKFKTASKYLKDTNKKIKEQRTPITALFDVFKKEFTLVEAEIKSDIDLLQSKMDVYATELEAERLAKEKLVLISNDAKRIESELQEAVAAHIQSECTRLLSKLNNWFEDLTLETIVKVETKEAFFNAVDSLLIINPLEHKIVSVYNDVNKFAPNPEQLEDLELWLNGQLAELAEDRFSAIADKKAELVEIARLEAEASTEAAAQAELKALQDASAKRLQEAKEIQEKAEAESKEKAAAIAAAATLSAAINNAPVATAETAKATVKTKTTQALTVTGLAGYDECYKYWRTKADFSKIALPSLASVTLDRIAKFVEKNCNETQVFLQHSQIEWTAQTKMK